MASGNSVSIQDLEKLFEKNGIQAKDLNFFIRRFNDFESDKVFYAEFVQEMRPKS